MSTNSDPHVPETLPPGPAPAFWVCLFGWLVVMFVLTAIVPKFKDIFSAMEVTLPVVTEAILRLAEPGPLLVVAVVAAAHLLWMWLRPPALRGALVLPVCIGIAGFVVGMTVLAVFLPIFKLQQALEDDPVIERVEEAPQVAAPPAATPPPATQPAADPEPEPAGDGGGGKSPR